MLFKLGQAAINIEVSSLKLRKSQASNQEMPDLQEDDLRRQMYERMAQGNALAEVEDNANRKWRRP